MIFAVSCHGSQTFNATALAASPQLAHSYAALFPYTAQLPLSDTAQSRLFSRDVRICFDLVFSSTGA